VVFASAACGRETAAPPPADRLPATAGTIYATGLSAPVTIVRDGWGIPHVTAQSRDDLFFAQGFVQAQDRLFQMDLWRRAAHGRLAEVLGPNFIERDAMTRRIQFRGDLDAEWASYGPDARGVAGAFTRGVNAWVERVAADPPEEFRLAGWSPERWRAEDLLTRTDAFIASGDAQDEILRAQLVSALGIRRANAIFPSADGPAATSGLDASSISPIVGEILRRVGTPPFFTGFSAPLAAIARIEPHASDAWAVTRGPSGGPWLAVDPHRPLRNPSPRYLVHLRAPGWHVAGATSPWMPGVAIGHNDRIAWGMTSAALDTQDIYVEELNPANPRQVRSAGKWVDLTVHADVVVVKGRTEPYRYEQLFTPRGVIVALDRERHRAYSIRWSGAQLGGASELAALAVNRAGSWNEFRQALDRWKMPTVEFVYADVDGRVARHTAGRVPRRLGWTGALPVPADDRFDWSGWVDHPPDRGRLQRPDVVVSSTSPARLSRINEVLADRQSPHTAEQMERLQGDVQAARARQLVPLLGGVQSDRDAVEHVRQRLLTWDGRVTPTSQEAALYVVWERELISRVAANRVPAALVSEYARRGASAAIAALLRPTRAWFDNGVQDRDRIVREALATVIDAANRSDGWSVAFQHPLAITEEARQRFNVGPFVVPGYAETVMSVDRTAEPARGASFRAVFDLSDWDRSRVINAPGQAEQPASRHFDDHAPLWAAGASVPFAFTEHAVAAQARATLTLLPATPP
jgi:penicillin amidase